eukprot:355018-Chlamydomonas_euryale.AAC.8
MHARMHAWMHACMRACKHACVPACMRAHVRILERGWRGSTIDFSRAAAYFSCQAACFGQHAAKFCRG